MREYALICDHCQTLFPVDRIKWKNRRSMKKKRGLKHFCSNDCRLKSRGYLETPTISCFLCGKETKKANKDIRVNKNNFCSHSCSAKYCNANKTSGVRRSKLELWLESQLMVLYPNLEFHFNRKDAIKAELDIYAPSLNLAFELNGIFHYEPIFGVDKLAQTQNNDNRKFQACLENGIELCIIDSSKQKNFKPKTGQKYLDIIVGIINQKLATRTELESVT